MKVRVFNGNPWNIEETVNKFIADEDIEVISMTPVACRFYSSPFFIVILYKIRVCGVDDSVHMKNLINDAQRLVAYKYTAGEDDSEEVLTEELQKEAQEKLFKKYAVKYESKNDSEWLSVKEVDILIKLIEGKNPSFSKKKILDRLNKIRINLLPF